MIHMSGQALEKIIADILDFFEDRGPAASKSSTRRFPLEKSVDEVCSFFMPKARSASLGLEFKVDPEILFDRQCSDETRVKQILTNLVGNAIKLYGARKNHRSSLLCTGRTDLARL